MPRAATENQPKEVAVPLTTHEGVQISWQEVGSRRNPPLLLINGHVFGSAMWHRSVAELARHHHVISYDNWGVGESGCPPAPHTIDRMAADAVAVLDAAGVRRAHVFGLAMGGLVAQELALSRPELVGSLVLAATACPGDGVDAEAHPIRRLPVSAYFQLEPATMYGPAASPEEIAADLAIMASSRTSTPGIKAQAKAVAAYRSRDRVAKISAPSLVIHGDVDRVVPLHHARALADEIPGAELVVIPATGHLITAGYPGPVNSAVIDFLSRHPMDVPPEPEV